MEIYTDSLLEGLEKLPLVSGVLRVGLAGDHLRLILEPNLDKPGLESSILNLGLKNVRLEPGEANLEDVFLALARG